MTSIRISCLSLASLLLMSAASMAQDAVYDVILRGGNVMDGTGKPGRVADVAIRGDRIVAVGKVTGTASVTIDASGLLVAPGFIDMHSHSDELRLADPHGPSHALQGVTTEVWGESSSMGPLGGKQEPFEPLVAGVKQSWNSLGEFLDVVERRGSAANFCSFVGSGSIRAYVAGYENRAVTPTELAAERKLVREAMTQGAMGVSSGLSYSPNIYMSTEELTALATEAAAAGGIYATHARTINGQDIAAIHEAIAIGEKSGAPVHFFHLNSIASWSAPTFLPVIAQARARGLKVTADAYPYTWGITGLADYLPSWALEGGRDAMLARLRDAETRKRIIKGFTTEPPFYATIGWQNVRLGVRDPAINTKLVSEVATLRHVSADDAYMDVVLEQKGQGLLIDLNNGEETLRQVIQQPYVAVGTDGVAVSLDLAQSMVPLLHPRNLATFPRWLETYVRNDKLMGWEEAIRRMTSLPASIVGLRDRGTLEAGKFADIVVLDPRTITARATFEDPNHYSEGVRHLFVNGQAVVKEGQPTKALPGRALRGPAYVPAR